MDSEYLESLVQHEMSTYFKKYCSDPRQAMILLGGVALNFMGDILGNESANFEFKKLEISSIILGGTNPIINEIILQKSQGNPSILKEVISQDSKIRDILREFSSNGTETILVVDIGGGKYKILDGMHRLIGHILNEEQFINAYVLTNYGEFLPNIEPHVVYDIIKAFQRSNKTLQDEQDLIGGLRILIKNTENTRKLLETRFDITHINDKNIQALITKALK